MMDRDGGEVMVAFFAVLHTYLHTCILYSYSIYMYLPSGIQYFSCGPYIYIPVYTEDGVHIQWMHVVIIHKELT